MTKAQTEQAQAVELNELPEVQRGDGNLNIEDIALAIRVIDYASQQGAFRGWEETAVVMGLRNRLFAFWKAASARTGESENRKEEEAPRGEEERPKVRRRRRKGDDE